MEGPPMNGGWRRIHSVISVALCIAFLAVFFGYVCFSEERASHSVPEDTRYFSQDEDKLSEDYKIWDLLFRTFKFSLNGAFTAVAILAVILAFFDDRILSWLDPVPEPEVDLPDRVVRKAQRG